MVGILRIERLALLQRPDARDLRLAVQIQPHDGQLAHRVLRSRRDVHRHVHSLLCVVDDALRRHLHIQVSSPPDGLANPFQPLVDAVEIGHVAGFEIAGLDQHSLVHRARPHDCHLAQLIALPFVDPHEDVDAFHIARRFGAHFRERHAHPAALFVHRAQRVVQQFAETALGIGRTNRRSVDGFAQHALLQNLIALERHLRHRRQIARRTKHDRELLGRQLGHLGGDLFGEPLRRQEFLNPAGIAIDHRLGGREFGRRVECVLGAQHALNFLVRHAQFLEAHRIRGFHLGHLKARHEAFLVRSRLELVANRLEHSGGCQAIAGRLEFRLACQLPHLESGHCQYLLAGVIAVALHGERLYRPLGRRGRCRVFLGRGLPGRRAFGRRLRQPRPAQQEKYQAHLHTLYCGADTRVCRVDTRVDAFRAVTCKLQRKAKKRHHRGI